MSLAIARARAAVAASGFASRSFRTAARVERAEAVSSSNVFAFWAASLWRAIRASSVAGSCARSAAANHSSADIEYPVINEAAGSITSRMARRKLRLGLLTGGGDGPGLNAVIRAVVKKGIRDLDAEVTGILDGFTGLVEGRWRSVSYDDVSGILHHAGTILGTSNKGDPLTSADSM